MNLLDSLTPSDDYFDAAQGLYWYCADYHTAQRAEIAERRAEAIEKLREILPPGTVVSTILRNVSRSGMSRTISTVIASPDDTYGAPIFDITWLVARALGTTVDQRWGGIKRHGAGMDFGFELVYSLSLAIHADGYVLTSRWL